MFRKERSKKSKGNQDTSWIVEGIVAYLRSPMWTVPVLNFVEENCGDFIDTDENRFEYTEIHQNYKKMVEGLLAKYMKELELTEEQFSEACSINNRDIAKLDQSNFEYIWAADDFLLFKRLMLKYNAEVQREAMSMLQQKYVGNQKEDLTFTEGNTQVMDKMLKKSKHSLKDKKLEKQEYDDMQLAIQFSKMEMERLNVLVEEERKLLEEAIRLSLESSTSQSNESSSNQIPTSTKNSETSMALTKPVEIGNSVDLPQGFSASSLNSPALYKEPSKESKIDSISPLSAFTPKSTDVAKFNSASKPSDLPPLRTQKEMTSSEAAAAWLEGAKKGITDSPIHNTHNTSELKPGAIDPDELAKRKAYLQEQRDKLLALKRKERNKQLSDYIEQKNGEANKPDTSDEKKSDKEDKLLASRRSIAERLKREVINKK